MMTLMNVYLYGMGAVAVIIIPSTIISAFEGAVETKPLGWVSIFCVILLWPLAGPTMIVMAIRLWVKQRARDKLDITKRDIYKGSDITKINSYNNKGNDYVN